MVFLRIEVFSQNQLVTNEIRTILEGDSTYLNILFNESPLYSSTELPVFYSDRAFEPGWSENQTFTCNALELRLLIQNAAFEGLIPEDYHLVAINPYFEKYFSGTPLTAHELAKVDFLLSDAFIVYASHIYGGKVHPEHINGSWEIMQKGNEQKVVEKLHLAVSQGNVRTQLFSLQPKFAIYTRMRQSMIKYIGLQKNQSAKNWKTITIKEPIELAQASPEVKIIRERLLFWGDLKASPIQSENVEVYDSLLLNGVKVFQERNGLKADGVLGKATIDALNKSPLEVIKQIGVNMERLRWLPDTTVQEMILVNIANYAMDFISKTDTLLHTNAIVGKSYRKTPVFNAAMSYLVFSPTWTVPPTILKNDVLPSIKKNQNYLASKNMRILDYSGKEINPSEINWNTVTSKNFKYMIREDPGAHNSLGKVKFMFPNKHNVYIHDTPARTLFSKEERALSSGCIRIQQPFELAKLLLADQPLWTDELIKKAMEANKEKSVTLTRKIPVIILYLTFWTDSKNTDQVRKDIYSRDDELFDLLQKPLKDYF
ncbi:peptidoglycan-binding protein [Cyclobacterium qasimii]|uniref:Peptidoglycan-binding protein n=2 Tax=Cyclobacterium qasimii TaxID=1350429 RepID=A0A512CGK9_9BACT|nr:peptidoglycan-binding protein [Cyclobacterium qasimii]